MRGMVGIRVAATCPLVLQDEFKVTCKIDVEGRPSKLFHHTTYTTHYTHTHTHTSVETVAWAQSRSATRAPQRRGPPRLWHQVHNLRGVLFIIVLKERGAVERRLGKRIGLSNGIFGAPVVGRHDAAATPRGLLRVAGVPACVHRTKIQ